MLGQVLMPADKQTSCAHYRLEKLLASEVGKRTFLATALSPYTNCPVGSLQESQVIIKLLLFGPDLPAEEYLEPTNAIPFELPVSLPYLESFEVETPLGEGLVLVKPYADVYRSNTHYSHTHCSQRGLPAKQAAIPSVGSANKSSTAFSKGSSKAFTHQSDRTQRSSQKLSSRRFSLPTTPTASQPLTHSTYSVFRIRQTPQKLEVRCPESRISEGLISTDTDATRTESVELWLSIFLALVVFVGGSVAITGSIWVGVAIAAILPLLFHLLVGKRDQANHIAILRITDESEGRAFVSLMTVNRPTREQNGNLNSSPAQSKLHASRLSIKDVKVSYTLRLVPRQSPLMTQVSFTFHNPSVHCRRLRIVGSYQEMRWLSCHFAQWGHMRTQLSTQLPTSHSDK